MAKEYDYLLKVLLVGDSDVGKTEILNNLDQEDQEGSDKKKSRDRKFLTRKKYHFCEVKEIYN